MDKIFGYISGNWKALVAGYIAAKFGPAGLAKVQAIAKLFGL